jgi:hypothetical protein
MAALLVFLLSPRVLAQEVGTSTQEILNNVASQQKPYAVAVEEKDCKILGIFNCLEPKVDYTHENRLPETKQIKSTGTGFWQSIGSFFSGLFNKSSDRQTGYGYTYLPQRVNPVGEIEDENVGGLSLESDTEKTHEAVKQAFLPYAIARNLTPGALNVGQGSPETTVSPGITPEDSGSGGDDGGGAKGSAGGNSAAEYAVSLVQTGGKACGWSSTAGKTKTLAGTYGALPAKKEAVYITCLQGKVNPEVYIDLKGSADGNSWLQCVGFVIGVEQSQKRMLVSHNAKDYCLGAVPPGYTRLSKAQVAVGDVVASTVPPWGHIMTIIEVLKGSNSYRVAEANWTVSGSMGTRLITSAEFDCVLRHK